MKKKSGKIGLVTVTVEVSRLTKRQGDALTEAVFAVAGAVAKARRSFARVSGEFHPGRTMPKESGTKIVKTPKWL